MKCFNRSSIAPRVLYWGITLGGVVGSLGCSQDDSVSQGSDKDSEQNVQMANFDANAYDMTKVVCDNNSASSPQHGLLGRLFYKPANGPNISNVSQIEGVYAESEQSLFFNNINEPTRNFNTGFITASGTQVHDDQGNVLIEYFGIVMTAQFMLSNTDVSGTYEFSLLADDGATFEIQDDSGNWQMVVNDDGVHPTLMGCSTSGTNPTFQLTAGHIYNVRAHYFQGPRYQISNVLMWKLVPTGTSASRDPSCGTSGNYLFFDPDHGSAPQNAYANLLTRGWSVVPASDFYLPTADLSEVQTFNPCYTATAPGISEAQIISVGNGEITVQWITDQPATSQVVVKDGNGNTVQLTTADNALVSNHLVTVTGLPVNLAGVIQVISFSATQGMAMSSPIPFGVN